METGTYFMGYDVCEGEYEFNLLFFNSSRIAHVASLLFVQTRIGGNQGSLRLAYGYF